MRARSNDSGVPQLTGKERAALKPGDPKTTAIVGIAL